MILNSNSAFCFSSQFGFEALPNISGTNLLWRCNTAQPLARFRWAESGLQGAKRMPKNGNICCNPVTSMEGDLMKVGNILYSNFM